ncbi:MAG: antibiotic biosynthesis monooxygenase family protein [Desulfatiglandales bacterium]
MITMTVAIELNPYKEKEFLQAIYSLKEDRKEVRGLQDLRVCRDREDAAHFDVIYEWEEEEDFRNYLETEHFKIFLGALDVLSHGSEIRCGASIWTNHSGKEASEGAKRLRNRVYSTL